MKLIGQGPDMIHPRSHHGCGVFNSKEHGGRPVIVTAGSRTGSGSSTSEFWDFSHPGSSRGKTAVSLDISYSFQGENPSIKISNQNKIQL